MALLQPGCSSDARGLGEQIYQQGEGIHGRLDFRQGPRWLGASGFGCAVCHGRRGEGRTVRAGSAVGRAPALTAAALAARGYDRLSLSRAIGGGVDPKGVELDRYMPRWDLSEVEMRALLDYLSTL